MAKQLKCFKCIVVDDKYVPNEGWYRFIRDFFLNRSYIDDSINPDNLNPSNRSIFFEVCRPQQLGEHDLKFPTLTSALKLLEQTEYDFHVFDLDLSDNEFYDLDDGDISEDKLENRMKFAGIQCFKYTKNDFSIKVIYSGSNETKILFEQIKILAPIFERQKDVIFVRDKVSNEFNEIENLFDDYLKKKQLLILNRQEYSLRQTIKNFLSDRTWQGWDELLVPDNGSTHSEEFWSLRSLFPKQITQISQNKNIDNLRQEIINILDFDWKVAFQFLSNHPYIYSNEDKTYKCILALSIIQSLEFQAVNKAYDYKPLSLLRNFTEKPDEKLSGLRDETLENIAYFFDDYVKVLWNESELDQDTFYQKLKECSCNFGIYTGDLEYLHRIAHLNSRHTRGNLVSLHVENFQDANIEFIWRYNSEAESQKIINNIGLEEKILLQHDSLSSYELSDEGMSDAIKIVYLRYKGTLELRSGQYSVISNGQSITYREDIEKCEQITEFRVRITAPQAIL